MKKILTSIPYRFGGDSPVIKVNEIYFRYFHLLETHNEILCEGLPTENDFELLTKHFNRDRVAVDLKIVVVVIYKCPKRNKYMVLHEYTFKEGLTPYPFRKKLHNTWHHEWETYAEVMEIIKECITENLEYINQLSAYLKRAVLI